MKTLEYYLNLPWTYIRIWSCSDKIYIIKIAELKNCFSHGKTEEEALNNIKISLKIYLESMLKDGEEIPIAQRIINLRKEIMSEISTTVDDFLNYTGGEDDEYYEDNEYDRGYTKAAIKAGEITKEEIIEAFKKELEEQLGE